MTRLLDTHVWVWWAVRDTGRLQAKQLQQLDRLSESGEIAISCISLWEVANLVRLGRLRLSVPLQEWLEAASHHSKVTIEPITAAIAAEVATLPDSLHRDPADRLIVATSRTQGQALVTLDKKIIESKATRIAKF